MPAHLPRSLEHWLTLLETRSPEARFRLGLERVGEVWRRLDITPPAGRVISVAGTNGKGSCALFCEAVLAASGLRVGTTLSPHLDRFNERVRICGAQAADDTIAAGMMAVEQAREQVPLSYFEHAILTALWCFDQAQTEAWVLEVGLGGRLDAVNIIDADVAIISTIGLEHTQWLGDSLQAIGREKAGILRTGKPLVCGSAQMPDSVFEQAARLSCPVYVPAAEYQGRLLAEGFAFSTQMRDQALALASRYRPRIAPENAATATMACSLLLGGEQMSTSAFELACRHTVNPGRLESAAVDGVNFIFDLAHNPQAAGFLRAQLAHMPVCGKTRAICGFLSDKDVAGTLGMLRDLVDDWAFVDTPGVRGRPATEVAERAEPVLGNTLRTTFTHLDAAIRVMKGVSLPTDRLLVFGSFTTVGEARRILGVGATQSGRISSKESHSLSPAPDPVALRVPA